MRLGPKFRKCRTEAGWKLFIFRGFGRASADAANGPVLPKPPQILVTKMTRTRETIHQGVTIPPEERLNFTLKMRRFKRKDGTYDWDKASEKAFFSFKEMLDRFLASSNKKGWEAKRQIANMLRNTERAIEKLKQEGIPILEPENHPIGFAPVELILGNVEKYNALCGEIRDLIERGENLKAHSRRLQLGYRLYPHKREGHPENWITIKEVWDWIAEDLKRLSPRELEALRNCESLPSWSEDKRRLCKEAQAKNRAQEKIRRAAISA